MAKKKEPRTDIDERLPERETADVFNAFVGGEDDDLMDMEYVQDEHTESHDTHPPQTKEEAELRASGKDKEIHDPTPPKGEKADEVEEDEEADDEAEAEAVDEGDESDDEPEAESESRIPKDRFDEVNERMKKAEKKLRELEEKQAARLEERHEEPEPEPYDYASKEKEAADALLEGDTEKYSTIQAEMRQALREETIREAEKLSTESSKQVREELSFEEVGAQIEATYPEFDADSEVFSEDARTEMLDLYVGYARSGSYTRAEALQKAAHATAKILGLGKKEAPVDDGKVVNIRKTDVKKKAKIADEQPPVMQHTSGKSEEVRFDVTNMSDEEFEALPESTKRKLRGDAL